MATSAKVELPWRCASALSGCTESPRLMVAELGERTIIRRAACCQMFFSLRGHKGRSSISAKPSLMLSMTSSGLGLSDMTMVGNSFNSVLSWEPSCDFAVRALASPRTTSNGVLETLAVLKAARASLMLEQLVTS